MKTRIGCNLTVESLKRIGRSDKNVHLTLRGVDTEEEDVLDEIEKIESVVTELTVYDGYVVNLYNVLSRFKHLTALRIISTNLLVRIPFNVQQTLVELELDVEDNLVYLSKNTIDTRLFPHLKYFTIIINNQKRLVKHVMSEEDEFGTVTYNKNIIIRENMNIKFIYSRRSIPQIWLQRSYPSRKNKYTTCLTFIIETL